MVSRDAKRIASRRQIRMRSGAAKRRQQRCVMPMRGRNTIQGGSATEIRHTRTNVSPQARGVRYRTGVDVNIPSGQRFAMSINEWVAVRLAMQPAVRIIRPVEKRTGVRVGTALDNRMGKRAAMRVGTELGTWIRIWNPIGGNKRITIGGGW